MGDREKAEKLARSAPALREQDIQALNGRFPAYLFRRRKTGEVWTTCCGRHETLPQDHPVMTAPHHREPVNLGLMCHYGYSTRVPDPEPDPLPCPFCGALGKVKELGRTGNRKGLTAWRRAVVLRQQPGSLWALACQCRKVYPDEASLTAPPEVMVTSVYRFRPGEVLAALRGGWVGAGPFPFRWAELKGPPDKLPLPVPEPFRQCSYYGTNYELIGVEELSRSAFRYCCGEAYLGSKWSGTAIRFLTLCAFWPRQVEMLLKAGLGKAVDDLLFRRKWNRGAFDWRESDPRKSFGLDRAELRAFLGTQRSLEILREYKRFRKAGLACSFEELEELRNANYLIMQNICVRLRRYGLRPRKLMEYLRAELERKGQRRMSLYELMVQWRDYINDAELLGYDLSNPVMLMPKFLHRKHMDAIPAAQALREKALEGERRDRLKKLTRRYTFWTDRWLIRPPVNGAEIAAEGKALRHCVGGYADRHLKGTTTILFLRDREKPGKPLVTIEMHGNSIAQIHGYRNDWNAKVPPRTQYAEILDPWLAWLSAGSRRDKRGRPQGMECTV